MIGWRSRVRLCCIWGSELCRIRKVRGPQSTVDCPQQPWCGGVSDPWIKRGAIGNDAFGSCATVDGGLSSVDLQIGIGLNPTKAIQLSSWLNGNP